MAIFINGLPEHKTPGSEKQYRRKGSATQPRPTCF